MYEYGYELEAYESEPHLEYPNRCGCCGRFVTNKAMEMASRWGEPLLCGGCRGLIERDEQDYKEEVA